MLRPGLKIVCADVPERQELMRMLHRRGYKWQMGQSLIEWGWDRKPTYLCIQLGRGSKDVCWGSTSMTGRSKTFQEVKDGLTRNRQTQRTSS